jgi:hypothetical protein
MYLQSLLRRRHLDRAPGWHLLQLPQPLRSRCFARVVVSRYFSIVGSACLRIL